MHCKFVLTLTKPPLDICVPEPVECRHTSFCYTDMMFQQVFLSLAPALPPYSVEEWRYASRSVSHGSRNLLGPRASVGWQMGRISLPAIWTAWHGRDAAVA